MAEHFPGSGSEGQERGDLKDLRPEARLREIRKMKEELQQEMEKVKGQPGGARDTDALQETMDVLNVYEKEAKQELRKVN